MISDTKVEHGSPDGFEIFSDLPSFFVSYAHLARDRSPIYTQHGHSVKGPIQRS